MASAGTTYRIVVYGLIDGSSGEAEMSSFQFNISMRVPVPAQPGGDEQTAPPPLPDTTPPSTTARKWVLKRMLPIVVVGFASNEPGSTFRCKLDERRFHNCKSPKRFTNAEPGRHVFKVAATDAAGNADPTPAAVHFNLPKPRHRKG